MHISEMDHIANNGHSFFHRAGVLAKMFFTLIMLTAIIIANTINTLALLIIILMGMFLVTRVPLLKVGHLAVYPAFFSVLFAIIKFQESLTSGLIVVLKALGAALTMIFLISTTSYVEIFAVLSLVLPRLLVDIFFFTYRAIFILLDKAQNLFTSIKLRGGYRPFSMIMNIKNLPKLIGTLLIHSFEMGERMHKIYSLRGYNGHIYVQFKWWPLNSSDIIIFTISIGILIGTVIRWNPW
ncbi:MAG: hypothetical protein APF76_15190 [Desulfitibacter sp. BRH_c19]|nr:MAG: hypothetical protein APF76_15190 [Desulfitibacter sp. BRH_c19]